MGFLVLEEMPSVLHESIGDRQHRFAVRNPDMMLVVAPSVYLPLRAVVASVVTGRRVACVLKSVDDVSPAARRLYKHSPGHLGELETAVFDGSSWSSHKLHELTL